MTNLQEQYVRLPRKLLDSPVWRVLNANEFRALFRIMEEHQRHSGYVNDGLIVTTNDFVGAGIGRKYVTSSLRVLEALGIIECTRRMMGASSGRLPNLWRPTFLPTTPKANNATHDYTKFTTIADAKAAAEAVRIHDTRERRAPPKPKSTKAKPITTIAQH
jgi:hypothetical protein